MCHTSWILSPAKEWVGAHLASVHHPTGPPPHSPLHQVGPTLCPVLLGAQDGGPAAHGALCLEGLSCVAIPGMTLPFLLGMMGGSPGPQDPSCHFLPVPHPSLGQGWRGWRGWQTFRSYPPLLPREVTPHSSGGRRAGRDRRDMPQREKTQFGVVK